MEKKYKWKCDICGTGFNNFQAEGFNNKIYCPLCYVKELNIQKDRQLQAYKDKLDEIKEWAVIQKTKTSYNPKLQDELTNKVLEIIERE